MSQYLQVKETVVNYNPFDFPMKVEDLIADLNRELENNPDVDLMINIDVDSGGYDAPSLDLEIYHMRDETEQERIYREKHDAYYAELRDRHERAQYERLKAKYG